MKNQTIIIMGISDRNSMIEGLSHVLAMLKENTSELVMITFLKDKTFGIVCEPKHSNSPLEGPHLVLLRDDSSEDFQRHVIYEEKIIQPFPSPIIKTILGDVNCCERQKRGISERRPKIKKNNWPKTKNGWGKNFRGRTLRMK